MGDDHKCLSFYSPRCQTSRPRYRDRGNLQEANLEQGPNAAIVSVEHHFRPAAEPRKPWKRLVSVIYFGFCRTHAMSLIKSYLSSRLVSMPQSGNLDLLHVREPPKPPRQVGRLLL